MKKVIGCIILAGFVLTVCAACSRKVPNSEAYGFTVDVVSNAVDAEDDGLYIFHRWDGEYLYYWDLEHNIVTPLCGKPDCTHKGLDCNAYFSAPMQSTLCVYNGKIYLWAGLKTVLYRMDLDGSNREIIAESYDKDGQLCVPNFAKISNGYSYAIMALTGMYNGYQTEAIYRQDLEGKEKSELIFQPELSEEWPFQIFGELFATDDKVYFSLEKISIDQEERTEVYAYDIQTGKIDLLFSSETLLQLAIRDNKLIYSPYNKETFLLDTIHEVDLETGTDKVVAQEGGSLTYDDEYLYVLGNDYIAIFDFDWNLVCKLPDVITGEEVMASRGTTGKCICLYYVQSIEDMTSVCHVYKKEDIGSGNMRYAEHAFSSMP